MVARIHRHESVTPSHPGEILREINLPASGLSISAMARTLEISRQHLHNILNESKPVTPPVALKLAKLLGNTPEFWLSLQMKYDLWEARKRVDVSTITPVKAA